MKLTLAEISRSATLEDGSSYTTAIRHQCNGYKAFIVDVKGNVLEESKTYKHRPEAVAALTEMLRMMDKCGVGGDMASASRDRISDKAAKALRECANAQKGPDYAVGKAFEWCFWSLFPDDLVQDVYAAQIEPAAKSMRLHNVYSNMLRELQENKLEVILIPCRYSANSGACIRVSFRHNCEWYRYLCKDFESKRKRQYKNFKTKVKRSEIIRILNRLIDGKQCNSMYAEWIKLYAKAQEAGWDMDLF